MEIINPRPKKFGKFSPNLSLSTVKEKYKTNKKIKGHFNGFSVHINHINDMKNLTEIGYFGKASFSRSYPEFNIQRKEILRVRQFKKRLELTQTHSLQKCNFKSIIVVEDSDNDYENYYKNLQPTYALDKSGIHEVLYLGLEEAFFLANCLEALDIYVEEEKLNLEQIWATFSESSPYFISNYIAFNYFRSKNWVVKSGIKFGGDFLLYKEGPPFYHASYLVIIDVFDQDHKRVDKISKRSMDNISMLCLNRLCETAGKELMICKITLPETVDYKNLNNVIVKEILVNRYREMSESC